MRRNNYLSTELLLERYEQQWSKLLDSTLCDYFEGLSAKKVNLDDEYIQRGDIIIRRQYGHHIQAWCGIVEFVYEDEVQIYSKRGRKKIRVSKYNRLPDWELKVIRPEYEIYNAQPDYQDFADTLYAEDKSSQPSAIILTIDAVLFTEADTGTKTTTLPKDTPISRVMEKKKMKDKWWYKIEFTLNGKTAVGWTLAIHVIELADPDTFTFLAPGGSGSGSSFKDLKDAIDSNKLLPGIARLINYINYAILPEDPDLPDLIRKSFYHALVSAKGDFKKAALVITAAVRAFKQIDSAGKFPWIQSKIQGKTKISYDFYRDKIWHFFWNVYEILTGTGSSYLDFKGVMYELKTREKPIRNFLSLAPLKRDAKEDIVFNRGGSMYGTWLNKNKDIVYQFHMKVAVDTLFAKVETDADTKKLTFEAKKDLVMKVYLANEDAITTEILKNSYSDYADYAGKAFENVLAAVAKMPAISESEEWGESENQVDEIFDELNFDGSAENSDTWNQYEAYETRTGIADLAENDFLPDEDYENIDESAFKQAFNMPAEKGITNYLQVSAVKYLSLKTGVFIPAGYLKSDKVDLVIYFHGLYDLADKTNGMEYYWKNYSNIRNCFYLSRRNAILIAPALTSDPQSGDILFGVNNGFDDFVSACIIELKTKGFLLASAQPNHIVIAAHSAGGSPLQKVIFQKNQLLKNVVECWGFDCLYNYSWGNINLPFPFYHYWAYTKSNTISGPGKRGNAIQKIYPSFHNIAPPKFVYHQGVIEYAWLNEINSRQWLNSIESGDPTTVEIENRKVKFSEENYLDESEPEFELHKYPLSVNKITIVKESAKNATAEIKESPSVFLKEILGIALGDNTANDWFNNFTRISFLGRELRDDQYIHVELARHLQQVEKKFIAKYGGVKADAKTAGDVLGLTEEKISGSRPSSATATYSYHMFGLAIDVNYLVNPFIQNKERTGTNEKPKEKFKIPNGLITMNDVLDNASKLFNRTTVLFKYNMNYDSYDAINKFLISYLTLIDPKNEKTLSDHLKVTSDRAWKDLSSADARAKIQKDLETLTLSVDRWSVRETFKEKGFLNHSKDFVEGLDLAWGSDYGDMMHFDMRTAGAGKKIAKAISEYRLQKIEEAKILYAEKSRVQQGEFSEGEEEAEDIPKKLNEYNPVRSDTLVVNTMEFKTGIAGITNYHNWSTDRTVIHNRNKNNYRDPFGIKHLVLHETAADTGDGFDGSKNTTAHLAIKRNASVLQFNDLVEWENHGIGMNATSIGIEFVNRGWLSSSTKDGGEGIPANKDSLTKTQSDKFAEKNGYLWAFWGNGFNVYRLPPSLDQLEKEVELVKWITEGLQNAIQEIKGISIYNMFPWISQEWLQLVSYNDVKNIWTFRAAQIPKESQRDEKNLFIMTTGYEYLTPKLLEDRPGIVSHNSFYEDHSDGSFLSLYTWLRIKKLRDKNHAFEIAVRLMKDHFIRVSLKSDDKKKIILLNVQDSNLQAI